MMGRFYSINVIVDMQVVNETGHTFQPYPPHAMLTVHLFYTRTMLCRLRQSRVATSVSQSINLVLIEGNGGKFRSERESMETGDVDKSYLYLVFAIDFSVFCIWTSPPPPP